MWKQGSKFCSWSMLMYIVNCPNSPLLIKWGKETQTCKEKQEQGMWEKLWDGSFSVNAEGNVTKALSFGLFLERISTKLDRLQIFFFLFDWLADRFSKRWWQTYPRPPYVVFWWFWWWYWFCIMPKTFFTSCG